MMTLLKKEMKLAASPLSYIFIAFGLIAFIPGQQLFPLSGLVSILSDCKGGKRSAIHGSFTGSQDRRSSGKIFVLRVY